MPFYAALRDVEDPVMRKRAAARLIKLRQRLAEKIPEKTIRNTLLLATWNIREFDSQKYGGRLDESYYYIAEIISRFDLVAVQEVRRSLKPLKRVISILGSFWDFIVTDVTEGRSGNRERIAFVFDKRKVKFSGVAGEVVLPRNDRIQGEVQFSRSPFVVSFQARWFKFNLCSVHIYFGADSGAKLARRIDEIDGIAKFMKERSEKERENLILLGDFNIISPQHDTMEALIRHGFVIPPEIRGIPTNRFGTRHYDQIAFMPASGEVTLAPSRPNAGTFDIFDTVFREDDHETYRPYLPDASAGDFDYYEEWRTYQLSDHFPLWVKLTVDFTEQYLEKFV